MEIIWKKINIENNDCYYISNIGEIKNKKSGRVLNGSLATNGYRMVHLREKVQKNCSIHRLVIKTFKPTRGMENLQINHIDGNKTNNVLSNLEWCSAKENMHHSFKNKLQKYEMKIVYQYDLDGNFVKEWKCANEAATFYNFDCGHILQSCKSGVGKHNNFLWRFFKKEKISEYRYSKRKYIYMYDRQVKKLLNIFSSNKEAARFIGCAESTMSQYATKSKKQPINSPYYFSHSEVYEDIV